MITPDSKPMNESQPDGDGNADDGALFCPAAALAVDGTTPEVGDEVTVTVKGTVTMAQDGGVWVKPTTINDAPAGEPPADADKEPDADDVMGAAKKADDEEYSGAGQGY